MLASPVWCCCLGFAHLPRRLICLSVATLAERGTREALHTVKTTIVCRSPTSIMVSQRSLHSGSIFRLLLKVAVIRVHQCEYFLIFSGVLAPILIEVISIRVMKTLCLMRERDDVQHFSLHRSRQSGAWTGILAEGAIARSMTLCGGVLFASWKLLQFPSS